MIASSLFHFTGDHLNILKILEGKSLRASFNIETVQDFFPNKKFIATPMVCFCDIPLKFISRDHTKRYGSYGIGFKKDWGIKNKVSPILYRLEQSGFSNSFLNSSFELNTIIERLEGLKMLYGESDSEILDIQYMVGALHSHSENMAGFIKSYEELYKGQNRNNYIDREWRWVHERTKKEFHDKDDEDYRKRLNIKYHKNPDYLFFEIDDLNYLVVKEKKDIDLMMDKIRKLSLSEVEKFALVQKIIDIDSINSDM
ncbi:abortive infection system antitoxin AbiGi family protein [Aquiflexum sp.]|uniref:abortive infection system antitoxin AbiGi family protein n=1 Tax=Aquiflexum sp. TaxID=1872584 RepID=UPI003593E5B6